MKNYNEFVKKVAENIMAVMPEEYRGEIEVHTSMKNNDTERTGILIRKGTCCPILYLEQFYKLLNDGHPFEEILMYIARNYMRILDEANPRFTFNDMSWENCKK